jgi:hypothetical protein
MQCIARHADGRAMTPAAIDVTVRVGAAGRAGQPLAPMGAPRGALPVTGASLATLVALALALLVLGTMFVLRARKGEQ